MIRKAKGWLPCASDFAAGHYWRGGVGVLMQGSLIFWPLAYELARRAAAERAMDEQLARVAAIYAVTRVPALAAPAVVVETDVAAAGLAAAA